MPDADAPAPLSLDHLVVGCLSLAEGCAWMESRLGVKAQGGGAHQGMGTHNKLWGLDRDDADPVYLELIAPDPAQDPPAHGALPFGLHRPEVLALLKDRPRLITWMARCDAVDALAARHPDLLGPARPMRRGDLEWRLTIPSGPVPPHHGALPGLIQWPDIETPSMQMAGAGLSLARFARRPDAATGRALAALGLDAALPEGETGGAPLRAALRGPNGEVTLD